MSLKQWVFVLCLLASLRPLSALLPLLEPWLRQGLSVISRVGQETQKEPAQTARNSDVEPKPKTQSRKQRTDQQTDITKEKVPPQGQPTLTTPPPPLLPTTNDQEQLAADKRLGLILDGGNMIIQIIEPESHAEAAGLNAGDQLLAVNGKPLRSLNELQAVLKRKPQQVVLTVKPLLGKTDQERQDVTVKLSSDAPAQP